eukprot:350844-Chlamydomonas_euryale.AAC.3
MARGRSGRCEVRAGRQGGGVPDAEGAAMCASALPLRCSFGCEKTRRACACACMCERACAACAWECMCVCVELGAGAAMSEVRHRKTISAMVRWAVLVRGPQPAPPRDATGHTLYSRLHFMMLLVTPRAAAVAAASATASAGAMR